MMTQKENKMPTEKEEKTNPRELVVTEFKKRGASHCVHIRNNLLNGLEAGLGALRFCDERYKPSMIRIVNESLSLLILYHELMSKYLEFRKGELESEKGYFPDIPDSGINGGIENYIFESEKRLNGRT